MITEANKDSACLPSSTSLRKLTRPSHHDALESEEE